MSSELTGSPLVILGMFRSGTSCVANCFARLGIFFGEELDFFQPDPSNPEGYFELKDLIYLNRKLLNFFDMRYFRIAEIPSHWRELPQAQALVQEARSLLKQKFAGRRDWGWKEPQTSVLLPIFQEAFKGSDVNPLYIVCVRNPLDAIASHQKHLPAPLSTEEAMGLWLHYTLSALRETRGCPRFIFPYEGFLEEPESYLREAVRRLGTFSRSDEEVKVAARVVDKVRRHERSPDDLCNWPPLVSDTFLAAQRFAVDTDGLEAGLYDEEIERLWIRWRQMRTMTQAASRPSGWFTVATDQGQPISKISYAPTGKWQTLSIPLSLRAGIPLHLDPYQTPCVVWVRRISIICNGSPQKVQLRPGTGGQLAKIDGIDRVAVWGPGSMRILLPSDESVESLEMELLVQTDSNAQSEVIAALQGALRQRDSR